MCQDKCTCKAAFDKARENANDPAQGDAPKKKTCCSAKKKKKEKPAEPKQP